MPPHDAATDDTKGDGLPLPRTLWARLLASLALSPQQARVVELILRNCSDQQIAQRVGIAVPTVRAHLARVFQRFDLGGRMDLVLMLFALSHGIRRGDPNEKCS